MKRFRDLGIGTRMGLGFAALIALLIVMVVVGITRIRAVDQNTEVIAHDRYAKVALAQTIENEVNKQARALRTALIAQEPAVVKSELAKIEESVPRIAEATAPESHHSHRGRQEGAPQLAGRAKRFS
jgi:methyl-accepting chemotaxis protein